MSDLAARLAQLSPEKKALLARQLGVGGPGRPGVEPVAVVGLGCRFPGGADTPESYWRVFSQGLDAVEEVPPGRWNPDEVSNPSEAGQAAARWGGWLTKLDEFDAQFFGLAPREVARMDPQQRLVLEVCWEALEDAGQTLTGLAGSRTGVFVGTHASDYAWMVFADREGLDAYSSTGTAHSVVANRLSYLLDLQGPSMAIDTACSSSLVAVHLAAQALRRRECDLAVACGVNLLLSPLWGQALSGLGMISPDGRCRTFDASANGIVRGEGCGSVVLKRLSEAEAAGDPIWAVIRGSATNQDGRTNGLTAPNGLAQQALIRAALEDAGVAPEDVGAIEAHGTGTRLGDPIEVEALAEVLGSGDAEANPCVLGSGKANIGHLEGAAGIAGLIKLVLSLHYESLPPIVHFKAPNPLLNLTGTRFVLPTELHPWPRGERPRRGGVSAFGFGGTNAHVVLEEAPFPAPRAPEPPPDSVKPSVLVLSACSPEAVKSRLESVRSWLVGEGREELLDDVCYTAWARRSRHAHGVAVVGSTRDELVERLSLAAQGASGPGTAWVNRAGGRIPGLAFVFGGQGTQRPGMGQGLRQLEPAAREALDRCDVALRAHAGWSVVEELERPPESSRLASTEFAQPAIFALQIALAEWWKAMGIVPDAVVGHSVGEVAAARVAGVLTLDDAARVIVHRARLMEPTRGEGRMLAVQLPAGEARDLAGELGVALAAVNGPDASVLSGDPDALERGAARLEADGVTYRWLAVEYAFHSQQMSACAEELERELGEIRPRPPELDIISTVSGARATDSEFDAAYWARNVREPVMFQDAIEALGELGHRTFVELGPHPALLRAMERSASSWDGSIVALPSLHRDLDDVAALRCTLGALGLLGYPCPPDSLWPGGRRVVRLPGYPWQRAPYSLPSPDEGPRPVSVVGRDAHPVLGRRLDTATETWESPVSTEATPWLADHRLLDQVIYPAAALLAGTHAAGVRVLAGDSVVVEDLTIRQPLLVPEDGAARLQLSLVREGSAGRVTVSARNRGERWRDLSSARVGIGVPVDPKAPPPERQETPRALDGEDFYNRLAALGAGFGPGFRGVRSLWPTDRGACAEVVLEPGLGDGGLALAEHPPLLDACLQVAAGALLDEQAREAAVLLPVAIERMWCGQAPAKSVQVEAIARDGSASVREGVLFDLRGWDDRGGLILEVRGLHLRPARAEQLASAGAAWVLDWVPAPLELDGSARAESPHGRWLLLAGEGGFASDLAGLLAASGETTLTVRLSGEGAASDGEEVAPPPEGVADLASWLKALIRARGPWRGIVHLGGVDGSADPPPGAQALEEACQQVLSTALSSVQATLGAEAPRIWLVGRGACAVAGADEVRALAASSLGGFVRVAALEHPQLRCTRVDLDPGASGAGAESLVAELLADGDELDVAYRHGERFVTRVQRSAPPAERSSGCDRLERSPDRLLEELRWVRQPRRGPEAGEVEIRVLCAGLNFRDVLNSLGLYPGPEVPLGNECVGEVVSLGAGVEGLQPGDLVVAVAFGSLADRVITPAELVVPKPSALSISAAATLPITYLTAHYALHEIAGLVAGERVLIHAGAGGVGLAAIHLAHRAGAEVFATAGSEEKRTFLRRIGVSKVMDSRTLDFADELQTATDGRGVDVVLNSLGGDFVDRSFSATAPGGRFLELGRRDIWSAEEAAHRRPDVGYHIVYLGEVCDEDPGRVGEWLARIVSDVAAGQLAPLPCRVFDRTEVIDAFKHMAQARHIGKVVLELAEAPAVRPAEGDIVRGGSTQLVTGGLGGVGLALADWLAVRGAGALALLGRSRPSAEAATAIERIRSRGTRVEIIRADVTSREDLAEALERVDAEMPPLAGVWHAAGVLDDATFEEQDDERFARVLAPKVLGAWNLHEATLTRRLDAFVLFSSIASMVGWPGQANYASANAVLDALAQHRRRLGLPGLAVNWGAWAGSGMAARLTRADRDRLDRRGLRWMQPAEALGAFEQAVTLDRAQVGVLAMNWPAFVEATDSAALRTMLGEIAGPAGDGKDTARVPATEHDLAAEILAAPAPRRREVVSTRVRELVVRTLGLPAGFALDVRQGLRNVGLDSLMAVELRNSLQRMLGRSLPSTLLFDFPTVDTLSGYLLGLLSDDPEPPEERAGDVEAPVDDLSDDEVKAQLEAELQQIRADRERQ